ncbi:MAG: hypothetical protein V4543_13630 [Bacteroidota bacterium]
MKKLLIFALILPFIFAGCCPEKSICDDEISPVITVNTQNIQAVNGYYYVYIVDPVSFQDLGISRQYYNASENKIVISKAIFYYYNDVELKNYAFLISSANRIDTIRDISYAIVESKMTCSACVPLINKESTQKSYTDFSFKCGGKTYHDKDVLKLE